jgi:DNA-binding NarL/FixJ family response regulator
VTVPSAPWAIANAVRCRSLLAAAGRTNREVAQALHISPKTVEANLGRIYDKLGIRSRAELGARMLERRQAAGKPKE